MISIIIPTLNEEKIIGATLKNLTEGLENFPHEIIVSDGASRDQTAAIARRFGARVIIYRGAARQTIALAKNAGAAKADGEYLVFLDADVHIPTPAKFFTKAIAHFNRDPHLVGLTGFVSVLAGHETPADKIIFALFNAFNFTMNRLGFGRAPGEFQVVRAEIFKKIGGFREDLVVAEDYDLFVRLAKVGKTRAFPDLRAYHLGRRAHAVGWPKLLFLWITNPLSVLFRKHAFRSKWEEVR